MIFGIKTATCPKCKKSFIPAPQNVFKISYIDYCSYTCFMDAKRAIEANKLSRHAKPVTVSKVDGEFVGHYKTAAEASRALNLRNTEVYRCLHGKQRHVKGFVFVYRGGK
jgi:hypothetical protein